MTRPGGISLSEALSRIQAAAERLRPYARQTPTVYSYTFSEAAGRSASIGPHSQARQRWTSSIFAPAGPSTYA